MSPTIYDIAAQAKVSKTAVAAVLGSGKAKTTRVSKETQERILKIAQEIGYRPSATARALVTGQTRRIAFWSPTMGSRFFQEVAYRFHHLLRQKDYEMITGEFGPKMLNPTHGVGLTRLDVDGVLMYGGNLGQLRPVLESDFPFKAPIVNMGLHCIGSLDYINIDLYPASRQAVRHLLDSGRRRVAHMLTEFTQNRLDGRYCAYEDVQKEAGIKAEYVLTPGWSRHDARQAIIDYVKAHGTPDGLFCTNDEMAIGAYRGLRDLGIRIPEDVALVGCDGIEDLEFLDPPISTIAQPIEEMIATAWTFLLNRMTTPNGPQQTKTLGARFMART